MFSSAINGEVSAEPGKAVSAGGAMEGCRRKAEASAPAYPLWHKAEGSTLGLVYEVRAWHIGYIERRQMQGQLCCLIGFFRVYALPNYQKSVSLHPYDGSRRTMP